MKSGLLKLATGGFLASLKFQAISASVVTSMSLIFNISSYFKSLPVTSSEFFHLLPHVLHSFPMEFPLPTYPQPCCVFVGSSIPPDSFQMEWDKGRYLGCGLFTEKRLHLHLLLLFLCYSPALSLPDQTGWNTYFIDSF